MKCPLWIVASLAVVIMIGNASAETSTVSHADSFSKEGLFKADVSTLKDTQLVAHPDVPLDPTKNVLWCGTLQLAWNEAIGLVGEKLHFVNQPPMVDLLNQEDFTGADLDADSYVALADFERNHVEAEIRAALEKTFHGAASPELIPPAPLDPGRDDFLAYAYLYKNLSFPEPFEDNVPIAFDGHKVKNFGFFENNSQLDDGVFGQVQIYDYQSEDNFIIKLKTKSPGDELILAKVLPGATLQGTIASVLKRIESQGNIIYASEHDALAIPKLNFDLRGDFPALEGLILKPGPNAKVKNLQVSAVKQLVRFQLNEKGAILKSEAVIAMVGAMASPSKPYLMIFDSPFLILMKRANSDRPYFALWVGNASLLVPDK
jgi:hypothetical protein